MFGRACTSVASTLRRIRATSATGTLGHGRWRSQKARSIGILQGARPEPEYINGEPYVREVWAGFELAAEEDEEEEAENLD